VAHDEQPEPITETEQDEAVLPLRMLRIPDQKSALISKHGLCLLECYAVLGSV
jgi:hypothetical protein